MILSIDQGTTSTRALVVDPTTFAARGVAQQEIEQHYPRDGWVEHEPEDIWYSTARTVREALAAARCEPGHISAIGITNQRETTLLWDRSSGRPVQRAIVWQDRRTADFCREPANALPDLQERTGLVLDPYFSGTKLRWMLEQNTAIRSAAEHGNLAFGTVDSFLIWRLSGGVRHVTDATNASRTLLFNIHSMQWDDDLLRWLGVPRALLPEVVSSASLFGVTKGLDFLPDGIPIYGVAGDQQAALYGQGCFAPGDGKCTYGTGAFYLMHTGPSAIRSRHKLLTTVAASTGAARNYALEGAVFIAGAAVQWLRDGLHLFRNAAEVENLARASNLAEPVHFVPGFVGLGAPHWVPEARGAIFGLTRATTAADLARAALEGVAFQVADLLASAAGDCPDFAAQPLRVDGGMARNDWFLQFQADVLGRTVLRAAQSESTALGAAMLAAVGAGLTDEAALKLRLSERQPFEPAMPEAVRSSKLSTWRRAVRATIAFHSERMP